MAALEEVAHEVLPTTYTYEWTDQSRDEREAGDQAYGLYAISLVLRYCCRFPRRLWAAWVPSSCEASRMIFICRLP